MDESKKPEQNEVPHEAVCPKCGHKFFHKIGEVLKDAAEAAGNAVAQAGNLGGDS